MSEIQKTSINYKALIITGLISLGVAVIGSLLVNYLTEERISLGYDLSASEVFSGSSSNLRIVNILVKNEGTKSIDDVTLSIRIDKGEIQEDKIIGLMPNTYKIERTIEKIALSTEFINPEEEFNIQLLLKNDTSNDFLPSIDLRGRGVIGKQIEKKQKNSFLDTMLPAILALTTAFTFFLSKTSRSKVLNISEGITFGRDNKHADDQRDVVSYILAAQGLREDSIEIRNYSRNISYWSICDYLTQKWMASEDKVTCLKGAQALDALIDYAAISDSSLLLIKTNIAQLYNFAEHTDKAKSYAAELTKGNYLVVNTRLANAGLHTEDA
tara:strand:- start:967 stop:1947 length:981 start_codon:yes stop_codon:yes gene_type:complete